MRHDSEPDSLYPTSIGAVESFQQLLKFARELSCTHATYTFQKLLPKQDCSYFIWKQRMSATIDIPNGRTAPLPTRTHYRGTYTCVTSSLGLALHISHHNRNWIYLSNRRQEQHSHIDILIIGSAAPSTVNGYGCRVVLRTNRSYTTCVMRQFA